MEQDDPIDFGCGFLFRSPKRLPRVRNSAGVADAIDERLFLVLSSLAALKGQDEGSEMGKAINKVELELLAIRDDIANLGVREPSLCREETGTQSDSTNRDDEFLKRCGIFPL